MTSFSRLPLLLSCLREKGTPWGCPYRFVYEQVVNSDASFFFSPPVLLRRSTSAKQQRKKKDRLLYFPRARNCQQFITLTTMCPREIFILLHLIRPIISGRFSPRLWRRQRFFRLFNQPSFFFLFDPASWTHKSQQSNWLSLWKRTQQPLQGNHFFFLFPLLFVCCCTWLVLHLSWWQRMGQGPKNAKKKRRFVWEQSNPTKDIAQDHY